MKPHRKAAPAEAAAAGRQEMPRCAPKADSGLSSAQAQALAEGGWDNRPVESPTKSDKQIIRENIFTYFNLIFVVLAVCLLLVGDWKDMTFLLIVAANAVIGIVQQLRSKRTIEKLSLLSAAKVRIIRGGKVRELPVDQLVREDVVELTAGCQIPADGPVLTGQVQVNEALITGEADAVTKEPGDQLLSGSFVISGKCRARMDQVGADSYASKLTLAAKKDGGPGKSEMMRSLDSLIRFIGIVLIPIGAALFYNQFVNQDLGLRQSVVSTVAALIGMIPEGLFLLTSVALAVSVVRLAQNRTLIHEMNAIETLARVDVLCVDKTGTVTSPQMQVREVVPLDPESCSDTDITDILGAFYRVLDPDNDTAKAIADKFPRGPGWPDRGAVPFTSATKWSAVNFLDRGAYVVGAPEYILGQDFAALEKRTAPYAAQGCRVLLLAQCDGAEIGRLHGVVIPLALLVLDGSASLTPEDEAAMAQAARAPRVICLINKSDRPLAFAPEELRSRFPHLCVVSAATGAGLDALGETVAALFPAGGAESAGELLTNARQADAARRALEAVTRASESLEAGITPDALLTDAEEALAALGELTGASVREDVTARIFERFCVGK